MVRRYPWRPLAAGLAVAAAAALLAAGFGSVSIPPLAVLHLLASKLPLVDADSSWPETWDIIVWQLRLPRILLAAIVGVALAISGATFQALFRNPLATPSLIGVSSGAGLGATIVMVTGVPLAFQGVSLVPVAAFAGGLAAVSAAYFVSRRTDGLPLASLILAGVAIAYLANAVSSVLLIRSDPDIRPVLSWLLGGFASAQWKHSYLLLPYLAPSIVVVLGYSRVLNVLQLDEEHAQQLGVNVERTKLVLTAAATLATAAAVSFSGLIVFVGLVAPHSVRLIWGDDNRFLLPMSAIVGAGFLILADLAARTVLSPTELPVGIVTAFCGAPFFLYLLKRRRVTAF